MHWQRTVALTATLGLAMGATAAEPKSSAPTPARPSIITAPLAAEVLADAVKAEETACTRRLDVCAKLREFAFTMNDESTIRQIDELERQTIEVCQARIARMGLRGNRAVARSATPIGGGK